MRNIDLRSDTITRPTPEMLAFMMNAHVGDDVLGEDPSVIELEHRMAQMFGHEAALFCASGTMANQIAIKILTQPLDEMICERLSHVYQYESAGYAYHSGIGVRPVDGQEGKLNIAQIQSAIQAIDVHKPKTRLVCLENTCNRGGGSYYTLEEIVDISGFCQKNGLFLHLDGARIFNALQASGDTSEELGRHFDTLSVCLSKGLGAPVGSVLIASRERIEYARRIRKVLGGGMRQAGYLAAAGLYALDHHIDRLREDHHHARLLGESLQQTDYIDQVLPIYTNIVYALTAPGKAPMIQKMWSENGIQTFALTDSSIRLVTHLDTPAEDIEYACRLIPSLEISMTGAY